MGWSKARSGSVAAVAAGVPLAAALASQAASARPTSAAGSSLTIYSGQHEQTVSLLVKDFEHRTGISVSVRSSDEAALASQILQEGSASPADVLYAENPALTVLEERRRLAPVAAATLKAVAPRNSSAHGDWAGVSARASVLKPAAAAAGVPWASWHTLRHTCGSLLFRHGANAKKVQAWLGHHSPAFTLAVYIHLLDDDAPDASFFDAITSPSEVTRVATFVATRPDPASRFSPVATQKSDLAGIL